MGSTHLSRSLVRAALLCAAAPAARAATRTLRLEAPQVTAPGLSAAPDGSSLV